MILISDPHGLPLRGLAPATAAETVMICPHDKPQPHARSVTFPDAWLPDFDPSMHYGRKCWWVCDRIFAAAVSQLSLDADFFWCVESDVAAKPLTWQRLIAAGTTRALDGIHVHLTQREADHFWFTHPTTPAWATHTCLGHPYLPRGRASLQPPRLAVDRGWSRGQPQRLLRDPRSVHHPPQRRLHRRPAPTRPLLQQPVHAGLRTHARHQYQPALPPAQEQFHRTFSGGGI